VHGNYAAVAMHGDRDDWQTYAALGLVGKTREAVEGLGRFPGDGPAFYAAVARWIDGDEDRAIAGLEVLAPYDAHARNLLAMMRKPCLRVLAQLPWIRHGCSDLITGIKADPRFKVENISFHPLDRPNTPYADVHRFYDAKEPPDFYACQMVEWHLVPPNLMELPCPILGHTADYDLHVQMVHPWLQLFDELVVTDPTEWNDVRRLVSVPVSTFPKSFSLPAKLPALPPSHGRGIDLFLSGTVSHAYHPDKATLLHQILRVPDLKLKIVNGFHSQEDYLRNIASTKLCVTYVRHPTALPTRGLEALAMGCAVFVQQGSVLTLYVGQSEGVFTYDLDADNIGSSIRNALAQWDRIEPRTVRGAETMRREFTPARVASQYFRFLTFLAARPRNPRVPRYADGLHQKRAVLQDGWLPAYDFDHSPLLKRIAHHCHNRLMKTIEAGPATSSPFIDTTRESVLYNYHRMRNGTGALGEWLCAVGRLYRRGLEAFPRSLPLRFNFIRVLLHFGGPRDQEEGLRLLSETLDEAPEHWTLDVMEDVFPWDFFPQLFNYRAYFDRITAHLTDGIDVVPDLRRLILASLSYYNGFFGPYGDFYPYSLDHFGRAAALDSEFPYYQFHFARELLHRGFPEDDAQAIPILGRLLQGSILFLHAFDLLSELAKGHRPRLQTPELTIPEEFELPCQPLSPELLRETIGLIGVYDPIVRRARTQIEFLMSVCPSDNRRNLVRSPLFSAGESASADTRLRLLLARTGGMDPLMVSSELEQLRTRVKGMESSKFWKLRNTWFRFKRMLGLPGKP
jgi:hypothetical protein